VIGRWGIRRKLLLVYRKEMLGSTRSQCVGEFTLEEGIDLS